MKITPFILYLVFTSLNIFLHLFCLADDKSEEQSIEIATSHGPISIELFSQKEPELVQFFLSFVKSKYYDNLIFHRIIDGFILQSGAYDVNFTFKEVKLTSQTILPHSDLKNNYGTLSLILRKDSTHLTPPQFFINLADNNYLNSANGIFKYEVIGKVTKGFEVIEKIAHTKVGQREGMYNVPFFPKEALIQKVSMTATP